MRADFLRAHKIMSDVKNTCATCKYFKPVEAGRFMEGGWCDWRPPMKLRGLLWGAHNEGITDPENEWCAEHCASPSVNRMEPPAVTIRDNQGH